MPKRKIVKVTMIGFVEVREDMLQKVWHASDFAGALANIREWHQTSTSEEVMSADFPQFKEINFVTEEDVERYLSENHPAVPDGKPSEARGMTWGDKGCVRSTKMCEHEEGDGCMWCCMQCNTDTHLCPGCGTVVDHKETACEDCKRL